MCENRDPVLKILITDGTNTYSAEFSYEEDLTKLVTETGVDLMEKMAKWINTLELNYMDTWGVFALGICNSCGGHIPDMKFDFEWDTPRAYMEASNSHEFAKDLSQGIFTDFIDCIGQADLTDALAAGLLRVYRIITNPKAYSLSPHLLN